MKRKILTLAAAAAILAGLAAYAISSTSPAKAANFSAVPPISGAGAGLCYWNDTLQPYAIDGGQGAVQPQTTGAFAGGTLYGMLQATSSNGSAAQQFDLCYQWRGVGDQGQAGYWYIVNVANGLFVSAEVEYGGSQNGVLRARSEEVSTWEKYTVGCANGLLTIKSQANGKFVSSCAPERPWSARGRCTATPTRSVTRPSRTRSRRERPVVVRAVRPVRPAPRTGPVAARRGRPPAGAAPPSRRP